MLGRAAPRRRALERVEVHAHEVDELDPVLLGGEHVLGVVAQREQAGVELRVQRLDAAVHDLREAGEVLDRADLEPGLAQRARGAAGGDELDAELGQAAREVDDAALVGDRQQRAADPDLAGLRHRRRAPYSGRTRRGAGRRDRRDGAARRSAATRRSSSSCSSGRSASRTAARVGGVRQLDRALGDDRPGVDALVDEVHGDAEDLHAVLERLLDRADARERRAAARDGR